MVRKPRSPNVPMLEKWIKHYPTEGSSRTVGLSVKNGRINIRITHYFEHYKDGIDARGEGDSVEEAVKDAILHFHCLLWKNIVRRSNNVRLNELKNEEHDLILKEMKIVHQKDFKICEFLKKQENRDKIYKNNDTLELAANK